MQREMTRRQVLTSAVGIAGAAIVSAPDLAAAGQSTSGSQARTPAANAPMFVPFRELKWERMPPIPGLPAPRADDPWPEIAILHVAAGTEATELMIRVPRNFHVPPHWHTANETHTIVSGTFIMACEGQKAELGPGSFNYMPAKMVHEGWTRPDENMLVFITVDGAWDVNFVAAK
jgi:mannose-6-phosphate isomerase-like protein (cupin superfamily)